MRRFHALALCALIVGVAAPARAQYTSANVLWGLYGSYSASAIKVSSEVDAREKRAFGGTFSLFPLDRYGYVNFGPAIEVRTVDYRERATKGAAADASALSDYQMTEFRAEAMSRIHLARPKFSYVVPFVQVEIGEMLRVGRDMEGEYITAGGVGGLGLGLGSFVSTGTMLECVVRGFYGDAEMRGSYNGEGTWISIEALVGFSHYL